MCLGPVYKRLEPIDMVAINIGGAGMLGYSRWQLFKGLVAAVGVLSIVSLALIYLRFCLLQEPLQLRQ